MKEQKIEDVKNMNKNNFNSWLKCQNKEGWIIIQIFKWQSFVDSNRLDFVMLVEREKLECQQ